MCPNIWNAHRIQSECLECTSNIKECTTNFHSDGIPAHSDSRVIRVLTHDIGMKETVGAWFKDDAMHIVNVFGNFQ